MPNPRGGPARLPLRRCVLCGRQAEKRCLLRLVRTPSGEVRVDEGGKSPGRGAYCCREGSCRQALGLGAEPAPVGAHGGAPVLSKEQALRKLRRALRLPAPGEGPVRGE